MFNAGDQVPAIPLVDVVGKAFNTAPEHIGATAAKFGATAWFTAMVSTAFVAHCPAVGVKV